jgi:hypothetical protein
MGTQAVGPAAAFGWLKQAVNLGRENPKAIFGSIALLALVAMVPSLVQVGLQQGAGLGPEQVLPVAGVVTLAMIVVYPLLIGGVLRVIHDSEHGRPTHATALFDTFRAGHGRGRLVAFGAVLAALYIATFAVVLGLFGDAFMPWYMQLLSASMDPGAGQAPVIADLPEGFGTVMGLSILLGLFFGGVYAIGFGQVALADRGVGAALRDGAVGTLKNLLPILLLAVVSVVLLFALFLVVALVGGLLAVIGGLVHPVLATLLVAPVYLGMLLVVYVVMFGVMYYMWRDICTDDAGAAPLHAEGRDQLEL